MKYVIAIIRPEKLDELISELEDIDVNRLTVSDCRGISLRDKTPEVYRGESYVVNYRHKVRLEIGVNDQFLQPTIDTITRTCQTGGEDAGDGVIFVLDLEDCINIRSGQAGTEGITGTKSE